MALAKKYISLNGELVGEINKVEGTRTDYLTDALGSVVGTFAQEESAPNHITVLNTYRYKPYGGVLAKTGSSPDPRYLWTGNSGSRYSARNYAEQYNWHRHYGQFQGQWTSRDPVYRRSRSNLAYVYVNCAPVSFVDSTGLRVDSCGPFECPNEFLKKARNCCRAFSGPNSLEFFDAVLDCLYDKGFGGLEVVSLEILELMREFCQGNGVVSLACPPMQRPLDWPKNCEYRCDKPTVYATTLLFELPLPPQVTGEIRPICSLVTVAPSCKEIACPKSKCAIIFCDNSALNSGCETLFHELAHCSGFGHYKLNGMNESGDVASDLIYSIGKCLETIWKT